MNDILIIVPERVKELIKDKDIIKKSVYFNKGCFIYPNWQLDLDDFRKEEELIREFTNNFYKRYAKRYRFNLMIFKKIIREKCGVEPDFCINSVKAFLFPSVNDLFII